MDRPLRAPASVVHVAATYRRAGTEQVLLDLTQRFTAGGHPVAVVIPRHPGLDGMVAEARERGAAVYRVGPLFARRRNVAANARDLYRLLRATRPDVVHFHIPWVPICPEAIVAARLAGAPHVVRTEQNPVNEPLSRAQRLKLRVLDAMVQRIVVVSEDNRQKHVRNAGRPAAKVTVIPNGVAAAEVCRDTSGAYRAQVRAALGLPTDRTVAVMVAALEGRKGILDFVRAARVAAALSGAVDFAVLGQGELRPQAEALVRQLGLQARFHFLGQRPDVRRILCAFDIYVLPSHFEGLSVAMLEALAAGLPMVATRVDGVADVLPGEAGALCSDVGDTQGLGRSIARLAGDAALRRALAAVSQPRARELFSVDAMCERYRALYRDLGVAA